jgi:MOSC domain-containing protein YiiM
VGRRLRIGAKAEVAVLQRDTRCKMITLDPDTAQANPDVLRCVSRAHGGQAGVYGAVLVEGAIRAGDPIALLD